MHLPPDPVSPAALHREAVPANAMLARVQAHVRELLGEDDPAFVEDLVTSFCESVGGLCDRVEAAMAAGDLNRVIAGAHQIKGSAANVGLVRVAKDWHAVEEAARRSHPDHDRRTSASDDGLSGPDRRAGGLAERVAESVATARHVAATLSA